MAAQPCHLHRLLAFFDRRRGDLGRPPLVVETHHGPAVVNRDADSVLHAPLFQQLIDLQKEHICIGIGARLREGEHIRELYRQFLERLRQNNLIPTDLVSEKVFYAIDPAGAVDRARSLVRGRVLLIGDAAGFVSGSTGEGIYPAMMSAEVASKVIQRAIQGMNLEETLRDFDDEWKSIFGSYIKNLPGGAKRAAMVRRIDWIFKSDFICRIAVKIFLCGSNPDWKTAWQSLWD